MSSLRKTVDLVTSGRQERFINLTPEQREAAVMESSWEGALIAHVGDLSKTWAVDFLSEHEPLAHATLAHAHISDQDHDVCPLKKLYFELTKRAANNAAHWFFAGYWMSQQAEVLGLEHTEESARALLATPDRDEIIEQFTQHWLTTEPALVPYFFRSVAASIQSVIKLLKQKNEEFPSSMDDLRHLCGLTLGGNGADNFDIGCRVWSAVSDEQKLQRL